MDEKTMIRQALAYIDENHDAMLALWEKLVCCESGTSDKEDVDRICELLREELEQSSVVTEVIPMEQCGNMLKGEFHGERKEKPILLIGHMDTVFPRGTLAKNPFRIDENGIAHGPGCLDMKAGLTIAIFALRALEACGYEKRPLRIVIAGDEETGHRKSNAREEIFKVCEGCEAAFNFETGFPDDGLVVGRMGSCRVAMKITGVGAHAGNDPQRGRSAILEAAHKTIEIQKLHDFADGLYVNVGVIKGGTVSNAIPAECEIVIDIRYNSMAKLERALNRIKEIAAHQTVPDTSAELSIMDPSEVMEENEKNLKLFEHVKQAAELIGYGEVTTKTVGGWSDSCIVSAGGIPVVCAMGIKGENNHTMQEYAIAETLFSRAKLALASIITL